MTVESNLENPLDILLSAPIYLRLNAAPFERTMLSIREHVPPRTPARSDRPLVVLTYHPGYLTGSYQDRDYFERVSPHLFHKAGSHSRLDIFTVNHPGYDMPRALKIDRFRLEPYRLSHQPLAMEAAFSWLFEERLAREKEIVWVAYGHSMGGLALSRYQPSALIERLAARGRRLQLTKILSAPAFFLHPQTLAAGDRLDLLHNLKQTVGRFPFYGPIATGLFRAFAPLFYRRDAEGFSLQTLREYSGFDHLNPFILLEQGRDLMRLEATAAADPDLLADTHIILAQQDGMIDVPATEGLIEAARLKGHTVTRYDIDTTHLLELDAAGEAAEVIWRVIEKGVGRPT